MNTARLVGAILVIAELSILAVVLVPLLWRYRAVCRAADRAWAELAETVADGRADFEPLIDRIAREHMAEFFDEWQQQVESEDAP